MTLRAFIPSIDPNIRSQVQTSLANIAADHQVRILFAIESGSRAWGFPSPDSDYDVRFVYVHEPDWYLSLSPGRDVIELPIEGDWDINGWDIRKAINLLIKANPVLLEWLSSPIRYSWTPGVCDRLRNFAQKTAFGQACFHHYRSLAEGQWGRHVGDREQVNFKKYFYILRPALALHWLQVNPSAPPPMNLQDLVAGLPLSPVLLADMQLLLERKSQAKEIGEGARIPSIDAYIQDRLAWSADLARPRSVEQLTQEGQALFRAIVKGPD